MGMIDEATQSKAIVSFEIKSPKSGVDIKLENLPYNEAYEYIKNLVEGYPDDEFLQEAWKNGDKNRFGFYGHSHGEKQWLVSADIPRIKGTETFVCPESLNGTMEYQRIHGAKSTWDKIGDDRVCSYCGSIHPDDLLELIKKYGFGIIGGTTKGYKWYVGMNSNVSRPNIPNAGFGAIKYYRWHDTDEFIAKYNELLKEFKEQGKDTSIS